LLPVIDHDGLERLLARMRGGKRAVAWRMPILRQHHVAEAAGEAIDVRYDFVAERNGELSARTEVVLDIDNE
jgi:hypothetical protein